MLEGHGVVSFLGRSYLAHNSRSHLYLSQKEAVEEATLDESVGKIISHWEDMKAELDAAKEEEGSDDGSESDGEEVVGSKGELAEKNLASSVF